MWCWRWIAAASWAQTAETHHGCLDYLSQIPGMTVLSPASFAELRQMLRRAVLEMDGPVAVRYPRAARTGMKATAALNL